MQGGRLEEARKLLLATDPMKDEDSRRRESGLADAETEIRALLMQQYDEQKVPEGFDKPARTFGPDTPLHAKIFLSEARLFRTPGHLQKFPEWSPSSRRHGRRW